MSESFKDAREAYRLVRQAIPGLLSPAAYDALMSLDEYFKINAPQVPIPAPGQNCGPVAMHGGDEYKCLKCGRVWDIHEEKPTCTIV